MEKRKEEEHHDDNENLEKTIDESTTTTTTTTTMRMKRPWEDLPYNLLELFLKPISEPIHRPNLSRVCKAWRDFKPPHTHTCFPALVHGPTTISLFIKEGVIDDEYAIRTCVGSCHGWLIIRMTKRYHHHPADQLYYLLNIYTNDTIQLPVVHGYLHAVEFPQICLSSAPTDPDCIILMYDICFRGRFIVFSKNNNNKWIKSDDCKYPQDSMYYYVFSFQGKFYALTHLGDLVAINLTTSPVPTTNVTVLPLLNTLFRPYGCFARICNTHNYDWFRSEPGGCMLLLPVLIESLGKLLAVHLYRLEKHQEISRFLDVLELDFETMSWIKVKNLPGDQVLFISLLSSFSISGSEIGIGNNCIYVSDHILGKIHRYDMHNKEMIVCTDYPPAALDIDRRLWVKPPTFV